MQPAPRSKPRYKTHQLMLYGEKRAVFSEIHIKHTNTLCEQNVAFVNIKSGGT
jgi:hypothetical protein